MAEPGDACQIVGRDEELVRLRALFDSAMEGKGQTVLISGEAGIGKTRLTEEIAAWASGKGARVVIGNCNEAEKSEPYQPFRSALAPHVKGDFLSLEDQTGFDELFLISSIGLLITHLSKKEGEGVDEDILSSMLTAVQDFVKDSFGDGEMISESGGLGKLEYKNKKVLLEHGDFVFLAAVVSGEEHQRMRGDLTKIVKALETEFAEQLEGWDGDLDKVAGTEDHLTRLIEIKYPVRKTIESMNVETERLNAQMRIQEVVEANAESGLVFVLEDAHWADETTLLAIPYLARNLRSSKALICCTFESTEGIPALAKMIEIMHLEEISEDFTLEKLSEDDVAKLTGQTLGEGDVPEGLAARIYEESGGNPFFTHEILRTMLAERVLTREDDIWLFRSERYEALPHSVTDIIASQLEKLDIDTIHIVEFASVLGARFDPQVISVGAAIDMPRVEKTLESMCQTEIIRKLDDGTYAFRHGMVQEAVYSGMSRRWHRVLHKTAGNSLEFIYEYDIDSVLFKLAYHFARTTEYEKGIQYSIEAGEKAANNYAPKESAGFFEGAVSLIEASGIERSRLVDVNMTLGELYELNGMYDEAIAASERASAECKECGIITKIEQRLGFVYLSKSEYDNSIRHFELAVENAKEAGDELMLAGSYGGMGKVYLRKGEYEKSLGIQKNYLDASLKMGNDKEIGQAYLNLGGVYWHMTDLPKTKEAWEKSLEHMKAAEDELGIAYATNNLGAVNEKLGETDEALENYVQCILMKKKVGDIRGTAMTHNNIGIIYDLKGEYPDAIDNYKKSLEIRHKIGDMNGIANAYNNLGTSNYMSKNYEESLAQYEKYLKVVMTIDDTWGIAQAYNNMSEPEIELGLLKESLAHSRKAIEMGTEHEFKDILSSAYRNQGLARARQEMWDEAFVSFRKSIEITEEIGELGKLGRAYLAAGTAYRDKGDIEKGREYVTKALQIFENAGIKGLIADANEILAKL